MNYRHVFHAGNFADVLKHVVLTRILDYLKRKEKAFRVIDTHAGSGIYDLSSPQAQKTGEWRTGIGRLRDAPIDPDAQKLLQPYLDTIGALNPTGRLTRYPGSPTIIRHLLRRQDRLTAIELHPVEAEKLRATFSGDIQVRVIRLDGWLALRGHLPPKEGRGMVLIDPPFEQEGEFDRLVDGALRAHRRWPGGIYALWYPIKDRDAVAAFRKNLASSGIPGILDLSLSIRAPSAEPRLDGCGLVVINPPYVLHQELKVLLPLLAGLLAESPAASFELKWLAGERPVP